MSTRDFRDQNTKRACQLCSIPAADGLRRPQRTSPAFEQHRQTFSYPLYTRRRLPHGAVIIQLRNLKTIMAQRTIFLAKDRSGQILNWGWESIYTWPASENGVRHKLYLVFHINLSDLIFARRLEGKTAGLPVTFKITSQLKSRVKLPICNPSCVVGQISLDSSAFRINVVKKRIFSVNPSRLIADLSSVMDQL